MRLSNLTNERIIKTTISLSFVNPPLVTEWMIGPLSFFTIIFLLSLFALDSEMNHRILLAFPLEIVLLFTGRRRSSVDPDRTLQEALRTRLRVVESNSQDVIQLFKVSESQT